MDRIFAPTIPAREPPGGSISAFAGRPPSRLRQSRQPLWPPKRAASVDLRLSEDDRSTREAARAFARKEIAPIAERMDREDYFPREAFRRLGEQGFLGVTIPTQYGGLGGTYLSQTLILEEIARISPALALSVGAHSNLFGDNLARNGTAEQCRKFLPAICSGEAIGALALTEPEAGPMRSD